MFDFYQKRKFKVILGSRYVQAVVVVLTVLMLWSAFTRYQISGEMADRRQEMEAELQALEARKEQLQAEVDYLSDERGIEAEMRRQFDVAKDGETVVVIVDETSETDTATTVLPIKVEEKRWYEFWR
jgi:cell division protein FtsB